VTNAIAAFSPEVNKKGLQAGKFIGAIAKICGGGGGGRPNLAQAGGRDASYNFVSCREKRSHFTIRHLQKLIMRYPQSL
jgi:alanyl-tRNA synthetase